MSLGLDACQDDCDSGWWARAAAAFYVYVFFAVSVPV